MKQNQQKGMKMYDDIIRDEDRNTLRAGVRFCPILKAECIQERCMWWVSDWVELKNAFQYNCAITLIAEGLNNEDLLTKK